MLYSNQFFDTFEKEGFMAFVSLHDGGLEPSKVSIHNSIAL